jgi:hypothetical protein
MSQPGLPLARIGRYELLERVGVGGMGEVFLARTTGPGGFEKQVVIKKILAHLADNPSFVKRFTDEGRLVVQLRHAGIAQILDMGEEDGVTYLAMEHVDGRDLRDLLQLSRLTQRPAPVPVVAGVLIRVLEALDYAHHKTGDDGRPLGIIHRDVSPSNVMISRSGDVKLVDFGIARATDRLGTSVAGAVQGKFAYMSPQQAAGTDLDARSDQFALGIVAWEMLCGERPFDGATDLETLDRIRHFDQPRLAERLAELPPEVADAVDRMLAKRPEQRFDSAGDAARALHGYLFRVGELVGTREIGAWVAAVLDAAPAALRSPSAAGLSLDDALRISLESDQAQRAPATVSVVASEPIATGLVTRDAQLVPVPVAAAAQPTPRALAPPPDPRPITQTVPAAPPAGRKLLGAFGLLIALNLLLLGSVAFLLYLSFAPSEPTPEPRAAASVAPAATSAPAPARAPEERQPEIPASLAPPRVEPQLPPPTPAPADATQPGRRTGDALAALTIPRPRPAAAPTKPAMAAMGSVSFRYYPANAEVYLDGRRVDTSGSNLVRELPLAPGPHRLLVSAGPVMDKVVQFTVAEGKVVNLGTITVDSGATADDAP